MAEQLKKSSSENKSNGLPRALRTVTPTSRLRGLFPQKTKNNPTAPAAKFFTLPSKGAISTISSVPPGVSEDTSGWFSSLLKQLSRILVNIKDARNESQFQNIKKNCSQHLQKGEKIWLIKEIIIPIS